MKRTLLALWVIAAGAPCRAQPAEDPPPSDGGFTPGFSDALRRWAEEALRPDLIAMQVDEAIACIQDRAEREQAQSNQKLMKRIKDRLDRLERSLRDAFFAALLERELTNAPVDDASWREMLNEIQYLENLRRQVQNQTSAILEKYPCVAQDPPERPRTP